MRGRVLVEQHAGVEQAVRVEQPLDLAHDLVQLVAVLAADERRHDPPGAVLGLERAAVAEHEVDHVLGEGHVAARAGRVVEVAR